MIPQLAYALRRLGKFVGKCMTSIHVHCTCTCMYTCIVLVHVHVHVVCFKEQAGVVIRPHPC